jgi:hypothetical protein
METQDDKRERAQSELCRDGSEKDSVRGEKSESTPLLSPHYSWREKGRKSRTRFRAGEDTCLGEKDFVRCENRDPESPRLLKMETQDDKRERVQSELCRDGSEKDSVRGEKSESTPLLSPHYSWRERRRKYDSRFRAREDTCLSENSPRRHLSPSAPQPQFQHFRHLNARATFPALPRLIK